MSWGMRRGRAGPELLRCSFVYTDGFQMLARDRSATERWGAAQQFGASANKPGLRQPYLGYLKNMALLYNNSLQMFPKAERVITVVNLNTKVSNIVLIY